jgi:hypothetical protein
VVVIENVGGMLSSGGAERVWRDLGRLGFAREIGLFTAAEVGDSQARERLFILAVADRLSQRGEARLPASPPGNGLKTKPTIADDDRVVVASAGLFPPRPDDLDAWRLVLERAPELEPAVRRMADGLASRVDQLRLLGNGVVPLEGAYAIRTLATRLAASGSAGAARLVRMMFSDSALQEQS